MKRAAHEERAEHGDERDGEHSGADHREGFRPRERMEKFPGLAGELEDGDEGEDDDRHREEDRAADLLRGGEGDAPRFVAGERAGEFGFLLLAVAEDVFGHHDRGVHEHADGDGDAGERHDVRLDAELLHQNKRDEDRGGERERDDEDAAEMEEEEDVHQRHEEDGFPEGELERGDGARDQVAAVVERFEGDARREARGNLGDFRFYVADDLVSVFAGAHHDGAADDFVPINVEDAAAGVAADLDRGDVAEINGRAGARGKRDGFEIGGGGDEAEAADDELQPVFLEGAAADVEVVAADGVHDLREGNAEGFHAQRGDLDLILTDEAADARDLGDAGDGGELVADKIILEGAEGAQVGPRRGRRGSSGGRPGLS